MKTPFQRNLFISHHKSLCLQNCVKTMDHPVTCLRYILSGSYSYSPNFGGTFFIAVGTALWAVFEVVHCWRASRMDGALPCTSGDLWPPTEEGKTGGETEQSGVRLEWGINKGGERHWVQEEGRINSCCRQPPSQIKSHSTGRHGPVVCTNA